MIIKCVINATILFQPSISSPGHWPGFHIYLHIAQHPKTLQLPEKIHHDIVVQGLPASTPYFFEKVFFFLMEEHIEPNQLSRADALILTGSVFPHHRKVVPESCEVMLR